MPAITRINYTHDALIDAIVTNPEKTQREFAAIFGYTESHLSIIMNSDAFQEKLCSRKEEIVNPILRATIEDRMKALVQRSTEILLDRLAIDPDPRLALKALEVTSRSLGYGAKAPQTSVQVNVAPVAVVPAKELSADAWMQSYSPGAAPQHTFDSTDAL